jgi:hypothetical protein
VDFVDVGFLGREGNVLANLIADIAEELVVDEFVDDCVLVSAGDGQRWRNGLAGPSW